ncbi:MAG: phosphate starvation-inducible protein PhoH [Deltaproteobacteria bacterium RBG_16_48_10]|nr:MAG: phosphate starvation-inducible protein PhoH [Deltaproteobacteria bacterium RBG_16_48_10]
MVNRPILLNLPGLPADRRGILDFRQQVITGDDSYLKEKQEESVEKVIYDDLQIANLLFGAHGENLKRIARNVGVRINVKGNALTIQGDDLDVHLSLRVLNDLYILLKKGYPLFPADIDYAIRMISDDWTVNLEDIFLDTVYISSKKRIITPKSPAQKRYIDAIRNYDLVIGIGPAGTGKTYLAMAMAVASLMKQEVERIVLTRPAVEAGEKLGFLPGDIAEKVNPYLRPLYDALHDMMDFDRVSRLVEKNVIEVAPLAFMRGRTLNDSFIILDEAQNTGPEQMKMFLTRLGFGSKAVITGDITQVDLPEHKVSGLIEVQSILKDIEGIAFVYFTEKDVVRHPLVQDIIKAYDRAEERRIRKKETNNLQSLLPPIRKGGIEGIVNTDR